MQEAIRSIEISNQFEVQHGNKSARGMPWQETVDRAVGAPTCGRLNALSNQNGLNKNQPPREERIAKPVKNRRSENRKNGTGAPTCGRLSALSNQAGPNKNQSFERHPAVSRLQLGTRVPGRGLVYRDEKFPAEGVTPTIAEMPLSSPQGIGAKRGRANVRPTEHKWAVTRDTGATTAITRPGRLGAGHLH